MNATPKKAKSKRTRSKAKPKAVKTSPRGRSDKHTANERGVSDRTARDKARRPKLLSGGNPQIPKGDGDGPVQAYLAAMPGWKRDVGRRLDALITRSVPKLRKAVRWNSPFYGVETRGWIATFHCFAKYVKVTFLRGTSLRPLPPGASKHPNVRYYDIREDDPLDEKLLTGWFKQASKLPGDPFF